MSSTVLPQFPCTATVPAWALHPPSIPEPSDVLHSQPAEIPPGPGTHPLASSFLRHTQQQQSRESRRMSSSARRAPAPITPILWLASARQTRGSARGQRVAEPSPWQSPAPVPGTHPCGRRPSGGCRRHRGSRRLQHSWLRSVQEGKSGYSWREGLDESSASPTPGTTAGATWLPASPKPSMSQGARLQFAPTQLLHTLGEPLIQRDQEPITHPMALPHHSRDLAQLDLRHSYCSLHVTSPLDTVIRKGHQPSSHI